MVKMQIGAWIKFQDYTDEQHKEVGSVISKSVMIHPSVMICCPVHFSPRIQIKNDVRIDKFTFINWDTVVYPNVYIGSYCSIGRGVQIGLAHHPINWLSTHAFQYNSAWFPNIESYCSLKKNKHEEHFLTNIGADVWIGNNALISSGISIGIGAIVGAGAVVVKDVPPYAIVGGVPAKIIKYRFSEDIIDRLLKSKWWLKNIDQLDKLPYDNINQVLDLLENKA
ncbi:CatB-related O-acetyltransferase [Acinetobacter sp. ME22]|uniref:CatB-related O-acetyltransferase n=1 Tax=Acinetobacter sp. ME22 TaxID=2904802 RepID=UPI002ED48E8E